MQIPADKKSSLQLSIEAELAVISAVYPASESSNDDEISNALGAADFVSNVAVNEASQDQEPDQDLLQEFNDSLGGNSEGILADALEEEADQSGEEEDVSEESGFGTLEKPSVDDITVESLEDDAFDAAAHEELKIEDDIEDPAPASPPDGAWPKSHLQAEIENEMGGGFSSPEASEEVPAQAAGPAAEPIPVQAPAPSAEPTPVQTPAPALEGDDSFARKPLWEGSDVVNAADYDDNELENIMDEIEDLEKKYRESNDWEDGDSLSIDSNKKKMTDLQKSIEDDINAAKIESHLSVEEPKPVAPLQMSGPSDSSLSIKKPEPIAPLAMDSGDSLSVSRPNPITPLAMDSSPPPKKPQSRPPANPGGASLGRSEMSFSATGQMNFNMDFKVGEKVANINVNGDEGLSCMMDDYKVVIKEGLGFILEMPGGAKLTIPVDNSGLSQKKKVG
jgi:hypothetical protein